MTTKTKLVLGLVGAAAAGVIIGILVAPESGADMRRNISRTTGSWADSLGDVFANAKGELSRMGKKGSQMANDTADRYSNA